MQFELEKWMQHQENNAFYFVATILLIGMAFNVIPNHIFSILSFGCIFIGFVTTIYVMSRRNMLGTFNILRYFHSLSYNNGIKFWNNSFNKQLNKATATLTEDEKKHITRIYYVWMNCLFNTKNNLVDNDVAEDELRFWFQPEHIAMTRKVFAYMPYTSFIGAFMYAQQTKMKELNQIIKTVLTSDDFNEIANYKNQRNLLHYMNRELPENTSRSQNDADIYKDVFQFVQSNNEIISQSSGINGLLIYLYSNYNLNAHGHNQSSPRVQALIELNDFLPKLSLHSYINQHFEQSSAEMVNDFTVEEYKL